jgi:hypothetical protein
MSCLRNDLPNAIADVAGILSVRKTETACIHPRQFVHPYTGEHDSQHHQVRRRGRPPSGVSASAGGKRHAGQKARRGELEERRESKSQAALAPGPAAS